MGWVGGGKGEVGWEVGRVRLGGAGDEVMCVHMCEC